MVEDSQNIIRNNGIAMQDGRNNKYDITQYIGKSIEYNELLDHLKELEEIQQDAPSEKLKNKYAQKIRGQKEIIEKFKEGVRKLAESFDKIEINTERLRLAEKYFKEVKFKEADAVLKIEDIEKDQENLLKQKAQDQARIQETEKKLIGNANEFIIKAKLIALQYDNLNRLQDATKYFQKALLSSPSADNYFEFAYFLQTNNQFNEAEKNYQEALEIYRELAKKNQDVYLPYVAMTLNNLAALQKNKNEIKEAEENYQEALEIRRELAEKNPDVYEMNLATTLISYYLLKKNKTNFQEAKEILQKYQHIPQAQNLMKIIKNLE